MSIVSWLSPSWLRGSSGLKHLTKLPKLKYTALVGKRLITPDLKCLTIP